jgi:hypothetical protein
MGFQYRPLLPDEVGVQTLITSSTEVVDSLPSWRLDHVSLDSSPCPDFVALSYEWGPETLPATTIDMKGQHMTISKHLSRGIQQIIKAMLKDGGDLLPI